ncbi:MAG TPA: DEAD/DEAH box helicase family protein [Acidimicrobiales bacterium]|nr:DEAD/DEAH box helicase family protein [Acidimicrobiales bacterium]
MAEQLRRINRIIDQLVQLAPDLLSPDVLIAEMRQLLAVLPGSVDPAGPRSIPRPEVPLSRSALLMNGRDQPRIGSEVIRELASADDVKLICAFVKWSGLRIIDDALADVIDRGGKVHVLTTAYMGATERRAIDRLAHLGASVKISYDLRTTRLHAKAWLFRRRSGANTAYVGSSNLSRAALVDGLEWNVRLSGMEQPHVLEAFEAAFDDYWEDPSFEPYDPSSDATRLDKALAAEHHEPLEGELFPLRLSPFPYQAEVLEQLEAERILHDRWQNLVVMATGTGKTVVSALDYERLRSAGQADSLLFIAHREELLRQSRSTFRAALRDGSFGEVLVSGDVPEDWRHVFASVQSLSRASRLGLLDRHAFDMIIVDEFHHSEAETYSRVLEHFEPRVLLGLTATPERPDGQDVTHWFGGRIAVELRLWEALDRGLLSPFQYFGLHDDVDVSQVPWRRGAYDLSALSHVYTGHDARARLVAQAYRDKVADPRSARALGFCVSIDHAEFMASRFNAWGIPSVAISTR